MFVADLNIDAKQCEVPAHPLTSDWPYIVSSRDDNGVVRCCGFTSLAFACDYAKYMDRRPLPPEFGDREVVLLDAARKQRFIPIGDGFRKYTAASLRRKAAVRGA
jgi:hypothetical protein